MAEIEVQRATPRYSGKRTVFVFPFFGYATAYQAVTDPGHGRWQKWGLVGYNPKDRIVESTYFRNQLLDYLRVGLDGFP